jgi:hypothetical protein
MAMSVAGRRLLSICGWAFLPWIGCNSQVTFRDNHDAGAPSQQDAGAGADATIDRGAPGQDADGPAAAPDAAAPDVAAPADAGPAPFVCAQDGDCRLPGLHCLIAAGQPGICVECINDGHCSTRPGAKRCDPVINRCVECVSGTDCPTQSSYPSNCTPVSRRCLTGCSDDTVASATCPTTRSYVCIDELYLCVECQTSADCASSPHGSICHPSEFVCVQCVSNSCPSAQTCDAVTGRCVECRTSRDCHTAAAPLCDPVAFTCVP